MSELEQRLSNIKVAKLEEYPWAKYWVDLKRWGCPSGHCVGYSIYLVNIGIQSYLNSPLIAPFGNLKEEAAKFNISCYHKGKLWLPKVVSITP